MRILWIILIFFETKNNLSHWEKKINLILNSESEKYKYYSESCEEIVTLNYSVQNINKKLKNLINEFVKHACISHFYIWIFAKNLEGIRTLDKELSLYVELSEKYNLKFTFLSYGKKEDIQLIKNYKNFSVIPIYEIIKQSNNRFIRYIKSFLIPFKVSKLIKEDIDLIKHNQLNGSWVAIILKTLITKVYIRTGYDMYLFSKHDKKSKLIQYLYKALTKFTLKFCDFYTVSSKADYEFLTQNFKNTEKIKIRPNSIKLCSNTEEPRRFSDKILCVGRLESQKNFFFYY